MPAHRATSRPRAAARPQAAAGEWLSLEEAGAYIGSSARTVRRYVSIGALPAYRMIGKTIRVRRSDLDALFEPIPAAGA